MLENTECNQAGNSEAVFAIVAEASTKGEDLAMLFALEMRMEAQRLSTKID